MDKVCIWGHWPTGIYIELGVTALYYSLLFNKGLKPTYGEVLSSEWVLLILRISIRNQK